MFGPRRRRERQSRLIKALRLPAYFPKTLRVGERIVIAPLDAGLFLFSVANITCATTHKCKDQIAAKLHSGWTPHRSKPWGSLGDTSGASTVIGVKCKKPGRGGP
jgi:hypothetical protein